MHNKTFNVCDFEKYVNNFHKKFSECKDCNIKRGVKRYYDKKDKISIEQKIHYDKKRDKLLQKRTNYRHKRNTDFKEVLRSHVELQNKLKAMEENFKVNNSENN